jgi:predicted transcriptional regulator
MSKQTTLLNSLKAGKEYTAKQITGSFGIAHPASAIRNLREQGFCIYSNEAKLHDGTKTTKYRLGVPSKRMVRIANAVMGASVFTARK